MTAPKDIARIQSCIANRLDLRAIGKKKIAGVIGDAPSRYSKSPALWTAVFRALKMEATYLPFDVAEGRLEELIESARASERFVGLSVTVPHKMKVMKFLDDIDEKAKRIQAVNTIVRTRKGRLVGYNTDGKGFLDGILIPQPGQKEPFMQSLHGADVLLIGAGGAARAVAFELIDHLGSGRLLLANRTADAARSLADQIMQASGSASAISDDEIRLWAPKVALIINASIKGQGEIRRNPDGNITSLEPYSCLGPANPAGFPESKSGEAEFYRDWLNAALPDIEANNHASWEIALSVPARVRFCDLVYSPAETTFLHHGRLTGHRTLNGRGMIIAQAAQAFFHVIFGDYLQKRALHKKAIYRRVLEIMNQAW